MLGIALSVRAGADRADADRSHKSEHPARDQQIPFASPMQFAAEQFVLPLERRWLSNLMTPVQFTRRPRLTRSYAPVRQIVFLGGDRITAEIVRWDGDQVSLRTRRGQVVVVPRTAITAISVPPGESDVVYESFEEILPADVKTTNVALKPQIDPVQIENTQSASGRRSLRCSAQMTPLTYRFPKGLTTSRVQLWFRIHELVADVAQGESTPPSEAAQLRIDFDFVTGNANSKWAFHASHGRARVSGAEAGIVNEQSVSLSPGWHCLTGILHRDRTLFAVNESLLLSTASAPGSLHALTVSSTAPAWIDDLLVSQTNAPGVVREIRPSTQDDCVALRNGEDWFGRVKQITATDVVLSTAAGDRTVGWSDVERLALCQSDQPVSAPLGPRGLCSQIQFQSTVDRPDIVADQLRGTITAANRDQLVFVHPWLGELAADWTDIAKVDPAFHGQAIIADARHRHLGESIRMDFQRSVPDGVDWTVEFTIPDPVPERAKFWLSLDVVELEPSGPSTPLASPFLKELRVGKLVTKVDLNNQPAGDLNRWINDRAPVSRPATIRFQLPAHAVKSGSNSLIISQILLKELGTTDSCELSNLRIDVVTPY